MKRSSPSDRSAELFRQDPGRRLALLKAIWPAAVRPELARRTEVVALDGDRLRIRVPDAIWRRSLWRMRRELLARLRSIGGAAAPHALSIVEGRVAPPPEPSAPPVQEIAPVPLPPALAAAADRIADDDTRERFREAVGRYLARFSTQPESAVERPLRSGSPVRGGRGG